MVMVMVVRMDRLLVPARFLFYSSVLPSLGCSAHAAMLMFDVDVDVFDYTQ